MLNQYFDVRFDSNMVNLQISKYKDPRDACAEIVAESYRLWLQYETRTDDITIIVVHINGLTDVWNYFFFFCIVSISIVPSNSLKKPHMSTLTVLLEGIYPDCYEGDFTTFTASSRTGRL